MNEELRELYQELIIDHGRHPRNFQILGNHTHCQKGYNPLCGDRITLYLRIENDKVVDASFEGTGVCYFRGFRLSDDRADQRKNPCPS